MIKKRISFKANQFQKGRVDFDKRIIYDVVLIEPNREATGHGMYVDQTMVNQVIELGQAGPEIGFKAKFDHPSMCFSSMGSQLGRLRNFREGDNGKAIADLHVGSYTKDAPGGDMGKWLLSVAEEDPNQVGFSIVFSSAESKNYEPSENEDANDPKFLYPHARIDAFYGADVVDEGAATSSLFQAETMLNNPEIITEKIEKYFNDKPELLTSLMPLLTKLQDKHNINTNTIQLKMSDNKESLSLLDKIKTLMKGDEVPEAPAVIETDNAHKEALTAKNTEIEALKAQAKTDKELSEKALSDKTEEFNAQFSELKAQIEALGSESVGGTIDEVATTDNSVELSEAEKEDKNQRTREEDIAFYANEQANGRSASDTYNNSNK